MVDSYCETRYYPERRGSYSVIRENRITHMDMDMHIQLYPCACVAASVITCHFSVCTAALAAMPTACLPFLQAAATPRRRHVRHWYC